MAPAVQVPSDPSSTLGAVAGAFDRVHERPIADSAGRDRGLTQAVDGLVSHRRVLSDSAVVGGHDQYSADAPGAASGTGWAVNSSTVLAGVSPGAAQPVRHQFKASSIDCCQYVVLSVLSRYRPLAGSDGWAAAPTLSVPDRP